MKLVTAADVIDHLIALDLFDGLQPAELNYLAEFLQAGDFLAGETIFREGDGGGFACIVIEGRLDVLKDTDGGLVHIAQVGRGRTLGEMSLVDRSPRSATVVALTAGRMLLLQRDQFERMLEQHPRIAARVLLRIARLMSLNLRRTSATAAELLN